MRLRTLLLLLVAIFAVVPRAAYAVPTTVTERAAMDDAREDHTAYTLPPDKLARAETLSRIRTVTTFGGTLWGLFVLVLLLETRTASRMRNVAINLSKNRWAQGYTFLLLFLIATSLLELPISIYAQHVRTAYGLSVQSWASWLGDQLKSFLLSWIIGGLLVMLLFRLIRKFPRRWWLVLWFPIMALVLFAVYVSPIVIDPLFNKFEPLSQSNPALVAEIEKVAVNGQIGIPPERMFLMKASAKTTQLNAYVTGFGGSKRVVIWDTLAKKMTPDQIAFTVGHEMGHYKLGHIVYGILFSFVGILVSFFLGFHLFQFLLRRFGTRWRIPTQDNWAALVVFVLVLNVIGFFGEPVGNAFSRMEEHAADVFGQEVVHGVVADPQQSAQQAFQVLGENSLDPPDPSPLVGFWTGSHPPTWLRAAFARHYDPWAAGAEPKYFRR